MPVHLFIDAGASIYRCGHLFIDPDRAETDAPHHQPYVGQECANVVSQPRRFFPPHHTCVGSMCLFIDACASIYRCGHLFIDADAVSYTHLTLPTILRV